MQLVKRSEVVDLREIKILLLNILLTVIYPHMRAKGEICWGGGKAVKVVKAG